ncbi:MAG: HAMP domain-containing sensor histidine kinase [Bryobacteraceae bacterium]
MNRGRTLPVRSWAFPVLLILLCIALGALQYRWIDEASRAERDRLRAGLQDTLTRLAIAVNADVTAAVSAFFPSGRPPDEPLTPAELGELYLQWRESTHHDDLFARIGLVTLEQGRMRLDLLDPATGEVRSGEWPEAWAGLRQKMLGRLAAMQGRPPENGPREFRFGPPPPEEALLFEVARFGRGPADPRRSATWLIFELDEAYVRDSLIPEHLRRYLGESLEDYNVEVSYRADPSRIFCRAGAVSLGGMPDAETALLEIQYDRLFRRMSPAGMREPPRARNAGAEIGRLQLRVRHRAGSLDAVVAQTRLRNLAVTFAILLLMAAALIAILVSTRRAQRLADLQMNFVTGVSHELRTPLTVIRTAAFNLRGKLAANPAMVEKYGALIQKESERLTEIVEQVLEFARSRSGAGALKPEPVSVAAAIEQAVASCQSLIDGRSVRVETSLEDGLPPVLAEPRTLAHCIQNLLSNAVKYGGEGGWVGISACRAGDSVEIRVADRGPGIPPGELPHVFDPFFRGRRAIDEQIHGTGLGLCLVRSAVESLGGQVSVRSEEGRGAEFLIRLRMAPQAAALVQPAPAGGRPA